MLAKARDRRQHLCGMVHLVNRPAYFRTVHHQVDEVKNHVRDEQGDSAVKQFPARGRLQLRARAEHPLHRADRVLLYKWRQSTEKKNDPHGHQPPVDQVQPDIDTRREMRVNAARHQVFHETVVSFETIRALGATTLVDDPQSGRQNHRQHQKRPMQGVGRRAGQHGIPKRLGHAGCYVGKRPQDLLGRFGNTRLLDELLNLFFEGTFTGQQYVRHLRAACIASRLAILHLFAGSGRKHRISVGKGDLYECIHCGYRISR